MGETAGSTTERQLTLDTALIWFEWQDLQMLHPYVRTYVRTVVEID